MVYFCCFCRRRWISGQERMVLRHGLFLRGVCDHHLMVCCIARGSGSVSRCLFWLLALRPQSCAAGFGSLFRLVLAPRLPLPCVLLCSCCCSTFSRWGSFLVLCFSVRVALGRSGASLCSRPALARSLRHLARRWFFHLFFSSWISCLAFPLWPPLPCVLLCSCCCSTSSRWGSLLALCCSVSVALCCLGC